MFSCKFTRFVARCSVRSLLRSTGSTGYIGGDALFALTQAHPNWNYSVLVRDAKKGEAVRAAVPRVQLVIGSLDDYDLIKDAAAKADIVVRKSSHQYGCGRH